MYELLAIVIAVAALGGLLVFPVLLLLAKVGCFEPLELELFGETFLFAPRSRRTGTSTFSNASLLMFPMRQTAFASVVTVVITVAAGDPGSVRANGFITGSLATSKTLLREEA